MNAARKVFVKIFSSASYFSACLTSNGESSVYCVGMLPLLLELVVVDVSRTSNGNL